VCTRKHFISLPTKQHKHTHTHTAATPTPTTLTFNTLNWNNDQTITLTPTNDDYVDYTQHILLCLTTNVASHALYVGVGDVCLGVAVLDDDVADVVVSSVSTCVCVCESVKVNI